MTICLNMIVKDESHIILDTLLKLLEKINIDYYVISDTGSSDNTIEIIETFFKKNNISGEIHQDTWKDFGTNRSIALEYAFNKADYIFIFDADDSIEGSFKLPDLILDSYMLKFGNHTSSYNRMCLVKGNIRWKYLGVLHEVISNIDNIPITQGKIDGEYFIISGRTSTRNKNKNKYLDDAKILEEAYNVTFKNNDPLYNRYVYYCANSYLDANSYSNALKWYHKTLNCNGWSEEKYNSCLKIYELTENESRYYYLVKSYTYNPRRIEGIFELIKHYTCEGQYFIANNYYSLIKNYYELEYFTDDLSTKLFANVMDYSFYLPYYMIIVCEKLNLWCTGIKMYNIIFEKTSFPGNWYVDNLIYNLQFYPEQEQCFYNKLKEYLLFIEKNHNYKIKMELIDKYKLFNCESNILIYTGFNETRWNLTYSLNNPIGGSERATIELYKRIPKEYSVIISGDVLEEEIDNLKFINRFNLNKINLNFDTIIISRYISFFTMFPKFKCKNLILQAHDTTFLNNLTGCNKTPNELINNHKNSIKHCICLTKWHAEEYKKLYPSISEKIKIINNGIDTTLFNYNNNKIKNSFIYSSCTERGLDRLLELWPEILNKIPDASLHICTYINFPINESENNMKNIIDSYDSIIHYGKLNQTDLYNLMSKCEYWLYTVNFNETSCITAMEMLMSKVICLYYPIGGLVDTIGHYGIQVKHGNEIEKIMSLTEDEKINFQNNGKSYAQSCSWDNRMLEWNKLLEFNTIKIINLKKRQDRKENINSQLKKQNIIYEFFEAVDGNELLETEELRLLFENNDFNYRKGIIGCALSHITLWKQLVESNNEYYVILEDDIILCDNFKEKLNYVIQLFLEQKLEHLTLGRIFDNNLNNFNELYTIDKDPYVIWNITFGYIISKSAAIKSLNFINKCSIKSACDIPCMTGNLLKYHCLNENLMYQDNNNTDIQNNYNLFEFKKLSSKVTIAFCDWWETEYCGGMFDKNNNFFTKLLENVIIVDPSENPDILFYSIFGNNHQNYSANKKIFYSGEPFPARTDASYNITFDQNSLNNSRIPLWVMYTNDYLLNNRLNSGIDVPKKDKFCSFISNGEVKTTHRKTIISLLSEYKRVDCGGVYLNNIELVPRGTDCSGKINFNNNYKFSIAFENEDYPGYVTEKILDIYKSNCIPIYWGTRQVIFDFNPSTFINANDFGSFEELVKFIIKVDNDEELYSSYFKEKIFSPFWFNTLNDPNKKFYKNIKDLIIGKNEKMLDNYFNYNFNYNFPISHWWFGNSELKQFNFEDKEYSILEIGCFEGCSSCFFSDNLKISKMVCVDPFISDGINLYDHIYLKNTFYNNIKKSKNFDKIEVKEMYSDDFFNKNQELFDFIYIDGEHSDKQIKNDLDNSFKCIKRGGIIWCDDYNNQWKNTFLKWLEENKNEVTIIYEGYQLGIIKNNEINLDPEHLTVYKSKYNKIRLGKEYDGGYIICDIPNVKYSIFLSGGILDDISFEEDFCNKYTNIKCYAYDGFIDSIDIKNKNINFIKKYISDTNSNEYTNLHELINNNNNIFIKMDIEGGEIQWINSLSLEQINKFNQIVIEFHNPFGEKEVDVFNKLNNLHVLVHFHANNCCGTRIHKGVKIPNVFECTYIHKKYYPMPYILNNELIPSNLDNRNVLNNDEIYIDYPPFVN